MNMTKHLFEIVNGLPGFVFPTAVDLVAEPRDCPASRCLPSHSPLPFGKLGSENESQDWPKSATGFTRNRPAESF